MRRKTAADIDHAQLDVGFGKQREHPRRRTDRPVPLSKVGLLRADVKRHPIGVETEFAGAAQQFDRHFRGAAEFARQWPFRTRAVDEDAAEHPCPRRRARELLELAHAVEGKQPQPRAIGKGDVAFLLYRVAERQPLGGGTLVQAQLDLTAARHVEIGALAFEHRHDRGRRVGLDRIIDAGQRQVSAQRVISLGDYVEIDDEARGFGRIVGEETRNPLIHYRVSSFPRAAKQSRCSGPFRKTRRRTAPQARSRA